jgi:hypothetical protein
LFVGKSKATPVEEKVKGKANAVTASGCAIQLSLQDRNAADGKVPRLTALVQVYPRTYVFFRFLFHLWD